MANLSFDSVGQQLDLLIGTVAESVLDGKYLIHGSKSGLLPVQGLTSLLEPYVPKFVSLLLSTFAILSGEGGNGNKHSHLLKSRLLVFYKPKIISLFARFLAVEQTDIRELNNETAWQIIENCLHEVPEAWYSADPCGSEVFAMMFELILTIFQSTERASTPDSVLSFMLDSVDKFLAFDSAVCIDTYLCVVKTAMASTDTVCLHDKLCLRLASSDSLEQFLVISHATPFSSKLALIYDNALLKTSAALAITFKSLTVSNLPHKTLKELCSCLVDPEVSLSIKTQVSEVLCLSWLAGQSHRWKSSESDDVLAQAVMNYVISQDEICNSARTFLFLKFFISSCNLTQINPYQRDGLLMDAIKQFIWKPGKKDFQDLARFMNRSDTDFMPWLWEQYSDNVEVVMDITFLWLFSKPVFSDHDLSLVSSKAARVLHSCLLYLCSTSCDISVVKKVALRLATLLYNVQRIRQHSLYDSLSEKNLANSIFSIMLFLILRDSNLESCISPFVDLLFMSSTEMLQSITDTEHFSAQISQILDKIVRWFSCESRSSIENPDDFHAMHVQVSLVTCIMLKNHNIALLCVQRSAHQSIISFLESKLSDPSKIEQDKQLMLLMISCSQLLCCIAKWESFFEDRFREKLVKFFMQRGIETLGFAVFAHLVDGSTLIDTDPRNDTYFDIFYLCQDYIVKNVEFPIFVGVTRKLTELQLDHGPLMNVACSTMVTILSKADDEAKSILMHSWWNMDLCVRSILVADSCNVIHLQLTLRMLNYHCEWQAELAETFKCQEMHIAQALSSGIERMTSTLEKDNNFTLLQETAQKLNILEQILIKLVDKVEYLSELIPKCQHQGICNNTTERDNSCARYSWITVPGTDLSCLMPLI